MTLTTFKNHLKSKKQWILASMVAILLTSPIIIGLIQPPQAQAILGIQCRWVSRGTGTSATPAWSGTEKSNISRVLLYGKGITTAGSASTKPETTGECSATQHYDLVVKPILTRMVEILPFAIAVVLPLSLAIMVITWDNQTNEI